MRFGVNYTPSRRWFHSWLDFSAAEVSRDLDAVAELGVDHIRVFPLWPLMQPNRLLIDRAMLGRVEELCDIAAERELDVCVDAVQGHVSSFDFLPAWLTSWHRRELFVDEGVVESIAHYVRTLAAACASHANLFAMTVGNELNQFAGASHPEHFRASTREIDAWLTTMIGALREGAGNAMVLHACDDSAWFDPSQPFTPYQAARMGDVTAVHSWVFNGTAQRYGADSFETRAYARYLVELARAFASDPQRPVWVQEVGAPRNVLPQASIPAFMEQTIASLVEAPGLLGLTWWCSHDVERGLADFPDMEYDLGLFDEAGCIKAEGRLFRSLVEQARRAEPIVTPSRPAPLSPPSPSAAKNVTPSLPLDLVELGGRAALAPGGTFWVRYMDMAKKLGHPRIVLSSAPGEL